MPGAPPFRDLVPGVSRDPPLPRLPRLPRASPGDPPLPCGPRSPQAPVPSHPAFLRIGPIWSPNREGGVGEKGAETRTSSAGRRKRRKPGKGRPHPLQPDPLAWVSGAPLGQPMPVFLKSVSGTSLDRAIAVST